MPLKSIQNELSTRRSLTSIICLYVNYETKWARLTPKTTQMLLKRLQI